MTDEFAAGPERQPTVSKSADEAIERLTDQLNYLVSVESVGGMVKTADLAAVLLQADRVAELEARVAELEAEVRELKEALVAVVMEATARDVPITTDTIRFSAPIRALLKEPRDD